MTGTDLVWAIGRATIGTAVKLRDAAPCLRSRADAGGRRPGRRESLQLARSAGAGNREPADAAFMAKMEAHRVRGSAS